MKDGIWGKQGDTHWANAKGISGGMIRIIIRTLKKGYMYDIWGYWVFCVSKQLEDNKGTLRNGDKWNPLFVIVTSLITRECGPFNSMGENSKSRYVVNKRRKQCFEIYNRWWVEHDGRHITVLILDNILKKIYWYANLYPWIRHTVVTFIKFRVQWTVIPTLHRTHISNFGC